MKKLLLALGLVMCIIFLLGSIEGRSMADAASGYVNIRNVFESIGAKVDWVPDQQMIRIERAGNQIQLTVGSRIAFKNGARITMDQPVRINPSTQSSEMSTRFVHQLAKAERRERHYRVKTDDSLWKISKRFGISVDQLVQWNHLSSPQVYPGQHLQVQSPYYTVQSGDTLSRIAAITESEVSAIREANQLTSDLLQPGQTLYIPPQPSLKPPDMFTNALFPLIEGTYQPYQNGYGDRRDYSTTGNTRSHEGIDIFATKWIPVFAIEDGRIIRKGWNTYGGWRLTIESENGIAFYYAHLAGYAAGTDLREKVTKGQLIGYIGSTGYGEVGTKGMFEPHLHLGMYDTSSPTWKPMNPYWYLKWWEFE
ncbi:LysM peptidoglycan-binding domain-containing protein [Ammoniphilus sp. CFH 90114]|uniref:LysM peptidoglycan-binding domain-containing protein n=1 Tax=Ammoniphilus sp. CFH 90114 TaxID=2493665 RepID=UPI001F0C64C3|nr:LysM peptidoglycan-binding domain-containing protein [Ammoniphilus sp. CFH 90114]